MGEGVLLDLDVVLSEEDDFETPRTLPRLVSSKTTTSPGEVPMIMPPFRSKYLFKTSW